MEYRQLGSSGLRVSVIGLGTNRFGNKVDVDGVKQIMDSAIDLGINLIDTADVYAGGESEMTLGQALKGRWDRVVLATKVHSKTGEGANDYGASRYHIYNGLEASLRRLQTDHVDLYQMHRWDANTPIEETLRALDDLVAEGKVRYIGASNYAAWQLARANAIAELRGWSSFVSVQNHYHMFQRDQEAEVLPYCDAHSVGLLPFFPLAGGFLTGKYKRDEPAPAGSRGEDSPYVQKYMKPAYYDVVERLTAWAGDHGRSMADLAHAWLLGHPAVASVISGATKLEQVESNAASADWNLTKDQMEEINGILDSAA